MKYKYILFDLDGTVSQSAEGIRRGIERVLEHYDIKGVDLSDYTKYIGPPLLDTLKNLCKMPDELCDDAYEIYRDFYAREGRFMNKPYDGIKEVLTALRENGAKLAVCTSKLESTAVTVIAELGLINCFDVVAGSNRDSTRKDKKDLIPYALDRLGGNTEQAVMLGDTWYDAKGAFECGVDFIACSYGYGKDEDMAKYNPVAWARSPQEIVRIIEN
ncbi:MAG: HAD hydrolase-like protein [Ruminococcus sp.]|nr:HAD hydrolase-like protein [Ruminococcus sp.]